MRYFTLAAFLISVFSASAQTKKYNITPTLQASITHTPGAKTVQVLMPGVEAIELDLTQTGSNTFLIKTADYNFDGYKDFALTSKDPADPNAPTVYDIYLYHPDEKTFEAPENPGGVCSALGNVRLVAADKTLRSSCRSGAKSSTDVFKWVTPYSLELTQSKDNSADAQQEAAEEKADKKAERTDQHQEKRDEIKDKKDAKDDGDD